MAAKKEKLSFEEQMTRIEEIVRALEKGDNVGCRAEVALADLGIGKAALIFRAALCLCGILLFYSFAFSVLASDFLNDRVVMVYIVRARHLTDYISFQP